MQNRLIKRQLKPSHKFVYNFEGMYLLLGLCDPRKDFYVFSYILKGRINVGLWAECIISFIFWLPTRNYTLYLILC